MFEIDLNEQFIIYAIYKGCGKWYISDKEVWYLDYQKRIEAYRKIGCEIKEEYIDERRKDLLCIEEDNVLLFLKRIEVDECSTKDLKNLFLQNQEEDDYKPSLYVDFDKKLFYSMYIEPASYEDYVPVGWKAKYESFLDLIPLEECYWEKQNLGECNMKIVIKNLKNGLENNNIKWYLSGEELWVTKYENYEDIEKSIINSEGSFNWLYEVNDTVLFKKENGKFETAIIDLSNKITTINLKNISLDEYSTNKGDIFLAEKKSYSFEFPAKVIYEKKEDCLFSMQEDLRREKVVILFITDDFGFVIVNDKLSGWVLKNASKHIYISRKYEEEFVNAPELLHCYFTALNLYYENEDDTIIRRVLEQLNDKDDAISLEIKECLENIL